MDAVEWKGRRGGCSRVDGEERWMQKSGRGREVDVRSRVEREEKQHITIKKPGLTMLTSSSCII